jgi:hypothetical protein
MLFSGKQLQLKGLPVMTRPPVVARQQLDGVASAGSLVQIGRIMQPPVTVVIVRTTVTISLFMT